MSWKITPGWSPADADAAAYITAVETADNQALENGVKVAIDNFVLGCKADGIWPAIKASCILAGARTLTGALAPLVGAAPTNVNFVSGDYNRKTGLVGNGSNKRLNSNRLANTDPQNSKHLSVHVSVLPTVGSVMIGAGAGADLGRSAVGTGVGGIGFANCKVNTSGTATDRTIAIGLIGVTRNNSNSETVRVANTNYTQSTSSSLLVADEATGIFGRSTGTTPPPVTDARIAFYSIGESLDLALLDARVTDLINAFAAAIP
jgi:hypothetical protein